MACNSTWESVVPMVQSRDCLPCEMYNQTSNSEHNCMTYDVAVAWFGVC